MFDYHRPLSKTILIFTIVMPHSLQAGEPDPLEKIEIRGKRYQHPNPNHQSYKGYYTGTGTIPTNHSNDEPSSGGGSSSSTSRQVCEDRIEEEFQICYATQQFKYRNKLVDECRWRFTTTVDAGGVIIKVAASSDEYNKCKDIAVADRDLEVSYCKVLKASALVEKCGK